MTFSILSLVILLFFVLSFVLEFVTAIAPEARAHAYWFLVAAIFLSVFFGVR